METQHLKQLAAHVRAILKKATIAIGHSQSLDLIASLVGLRNWPEVQAFPQRVDAQILDLAACSRLAYRLERKYSHQIGASDLLAMLRPSEAKEETLLQIWPAGPKAGVYLTTSQTAIEALIFQYQEATDGAVFYAESAGATHDAAINLGDDGLWSHGLERVPSGTLLVLGPIELDQQSWEDASEHIEMACIRAESSGHRVAILFDTPTPDDIGADAVTMLMGKGYDDPQDLQMYLIGTVTEDGTLQPGLSTNYRAPVKKVAPPVTRALPTAVESSLKSILAKHSTGIIALGSTEEEENKGTILAEAVLALTEHLGFAARILPRHRSTMSKFDMVPAGIAQIPTLPSLESAYAQGYRRFLVEPGYTKPKHLLQYVDDALIIAYAYATSADQIATQTLMPFGTDRWRLLNLLASIVVMPVSTKAGIAYLTDMYVKPDAVHPDTDDDNFDFVAVNRILRIENQLREMVQDGAVTLPPKGSPKDVNRTLKRLAEML